MARKFGTFLDTRVSGKERLASAKDATAASTMRQIYSFYTDAFWIAVKSILEHKLRAFLTLIGIIIGVAAVVVVGASISGLKSYVIERVTKVLGTNHFMITRLASTARMSDEEFETRNRRNKDVTWEEYLYVKANCKNCYAVSAELNSGADISYNGVEMPSVRVGGRTGNALEIDEKDIVLGRFFGESEVIRSAAVCVIGSDVQEKFFPATSPLDKRIKVRGVPLTIIGVEGKRGSFFGNPLDRNIFIPITRYNQMFSHAGGLEIHGKALDSESFSRAMDDARLALRNKRQLIGSEDDTFSLVNTDEFNAQVDQMTGAIAAVVVPITMIILVVGGIVVMNIMLVSVTERTFEVGLRKALGATKQQILLQFLIESALLCVLGGTLGLLLSLVATLLVGWVLAITMTITPGYIVLSITVSSVIGVIAGLYPAWKAARLDPIVALTQS